MIHTLDTIHWGKIHVPEHYQLSHSTKDSYEHINSNARVVQAKCNAKQKTNYSRR